MRKNVSHSWWVPLPTTEEESANATAPHGSLAKARVLLLLAAALFGTYAVVLRALFSLRGPIMPTPFLSAARFAVMLAYVLVYRVSALLSRLLHRSCVATSSQYVWDPHEKADATPPLQLTCAAIELAAIDVAANLLSVP